jgi:hypothetical protein
MPIYLKISGSREAAFIDTLREFPLRREWIHECRGRMDTQERLSSKHPNSVTRL